MSTITAARPKAGALASPINIPKQLPPNYKGRPLRQLSYSAVNRFRLCPEDFRRSYICGEWGPTGGAQFVGNRVDDAVSGFYGRQLTGQLLDLEQVKDLYDEIWRAELAYERERHRGVRWAPGLRAEDAHALGLQALEVTMAELVPRLGRPIAVQRKFEMKIDPSLEWSIVGAADLDTIRQQTVYLDEHGQEHPLLRDEGMLEPTIALPYTTAPAQWRPQVKRGRDMLEPREAITAYERDLATYEEQLTAWRAAGEGKEPKAPRPLPEVLVPVSELTVQAVRREVAGITDYKVTNTLRAESTAAVDLQASLYLGERWLAGDPAWDFRFAQVGKPVEGRRKTMTTSLVATRRSEHDLRVVFARFAQTARAIWALYNQLGPDEPWGWATVEWKCKHCEHGPRGSDSCPFALTAA